MEARELRIGNRVWFEDEKLCMTTEGVIRSIKATGEFTNLGNEIYEVSMIDQWGNLQTENLIDLEPIHLTPEILKKCGFDDMHELTYGMVDMADKRHCVYAANNGYQFHPFCTNDKDCQIQVKYLHHFQNLIFCFTGQELDYKH